MNQDYLQIRMRKGINNMKEIRVSKHARERYAERVKEKNDKLDMARYVIENEAKIDKDISAMVEYGILVYKGPQRWNEKNNTAIEIYVNDLWVVLLDSKTENVITLYKVELGCGEELNLTYNPLRAGKPTVSTVRMIVRALFNCRYKFDYHLQM